MVAINNSLVRIFVIFLCALFLHDCTVDAKGGRGGGRGGSRGGSRSSRSSRSSTSRSTRSSGFRTRSGLSWQTAAAAGYLYGFTRYKTRRYYTRYPNREPQICVNRYDYLMNNGTNYEYFICPMYNQGDDYRYCCGPNDRQKCCRFWDSPGRVAGTVIGILIAIGFLGCLIWCCVKSRRKPPSDGSILMVQTKTTSQPPVSNGPPPVSGPAPTYPQTPADGTYYPPDQPPPIYKQPENGPNAPPYPSQVPGGYPAMPGYPTQDPNQFPNAAPYPPGPYPPGPPQDGVPVPAPAPGYGNNTAPYPAGPTPYPVGPPPPGGAPPAGAPPYPAGDTSYPVSPPPSYDNAKM